MMALPEIEETGILLGALVVKKETDCTGGE